MVKLGIIADDLTGAMDTGVQFAKGGLQTVVMLEEGAMPTAEMVVVSTDSRDLSAEEAYRSAREVATRFSDRTVYKKIDSTLRGNVGAELDGLMDGLGLEHALVAPAFPANGRTTVGGYHLVHGVPLAESSFANDPIWPARESHLPALLSRQSQRAVRYLPLSIIELGVEAVTQFLRNEKAPIVAADAENSGHLLTLAMSLAQLEGWLPCGSAGLAEEWPRALGLERPKTVFRWPEDSRPVLVLSGSRNRAAAEQLRQASARGYLEIVRVSAEEEEQSGATAMAVDLLVQGHNVALTTTFSPYHQGQGIVAAQILAALGKSVLDRCPVAGLFMTGGDIARATCHAGGAGALQALGEAQPGVAAGLLIGGPYEGLRVVTKAGGFGNDRAIIESIDCLRGKLK